ncbi:hypothetical protein C8Q76DRAFT_726547 [Earliella scabrosa]|nr:hypothetical protein C8Q76DRAFT_726547 [Earliella scabrosa]
MRPDEPTPGEEPAASADERDQEDRRRGGDPDTISDSDDARESRGCASTGFVHGSTQCEVTFCPHPLEDGRFCHSHKAAHRSSLIGLRSAESSALKSWDAVRTHLTLGVPGPIIMVKWWIYSSAIGANLRLEEQHQQQFRCSAAHEHQRRVHDLEAKLDTARRSFRAHFYEALAAVVTLLGFAFLSCEWLQLSKWSMVMVGCATIVGCFQLVVYFARLEVK